MRAQAIATLIGVGLGAVGCGASGEAPWPDAVAAQVVEEPLALELTYGDQLLPALAGDGRSAFYLEADGERIHLSGAPQRSRDGHERLLVYRTADDRQALVRIAPAAEQSLRVGFEVRGKSDAERLGVSLRVGADEGFYGLMEKVVQGLQDDSWQQGMSAGLDLRGQSAELFVLPTTSIYSPFFVSSAGYGVQVESDWVGSYRFGVDHPERVEIEYEGPQLVLRIYPGPDPLAAAARYARAVGPSLLPPRWVFGPWRWRNAVWDLPAFYDGTVYDGPYNSMVVEDILMMEALGIPCDLYWVDRPWAQGDFGYDDLAWDEQRLPQPVEMIDWLDARGTRFMLWLAPWAKGEMAAEAEQRGYTVDMALPTYPGDAPLLDLTHPEAVAWWQEKLGARIDDGVVGFKLDRGEEKVPDGRYFQGHYHDGTAYRPGRNLYPRWYAAAVHGAFERAGVDQFAVMPRAAWAGSQRHAIFWGGDTAPSHYGLRSAIIALQRASLLHFPVWGSDTCGYGRSTHEVCARWLAFSAFCPLMEVGPTNDLAPWSRVPDGESGGVGPGGYRHQPHYDHALLAIWSLYARLHDELKDYSYAQAAAAHERGTPFVRPMFAAYPERPEYRDLFSQYLYGPDILVRPVWEQGAEQVEVHIPPRGEWVDAWSGQTMTPGQTVQVAVPEHKIPIYIRAGSQVDLGDLPARWQSAQQRTQTPPDLAALAAEVE